MAYHTLRSPHLVSKINCRTTISCFIIKRTSWSNKMRYICYVDTDLLYQYFRIVESMLQIMVVNVYLW